MNESTKAKAGLVYNVVESVILAMSVGLMVWLANTVITHGNTLASQGNQIGVNTMRIDRIETTGSPQLVAHESQDDARISAHNARIERLEAAVLILQATPGELKAMTVEMRGLREGQDRILKSLDEHMRNGK